MSAGVSPSSVTPAVASLTGGSPGAVSPVGCCPCAACLAGMSAGSPNSAAAQVFPPDRYALFMTHDDVVQRVGFAVRRGLAVRQNPDLAALDAALRAAGRTDWPPRWGISGFRR